MKIAHIDTERTWRGGQQQVEWLVRGLEARGHDNLLVVRDGGALCRRMRGRHVLAVRPFAEWDPAAALKIRGRLLDASVDVVHAHTAHAVFLAGLATLGTRIPVVATRRVDFHLSKNPFTRWKYGRAERLIAISRGVRDVLVQDGIPSAKISLVPSGVDWTRYRHVTPLTRTALGLPRGGRIVGQVAALAPHKDQTTFLESLVLLARRMPGVRGVIVGDGPLRDKLQAKIAELGLFGVVTLAGFQDRPLDYLAAFDAFCLSSSEEGLGTSLIDAMALRVPVVATRVGGIPDLVTDRVTGYLAEPRDPGALADALETCLLAPDRNRAMLEAAALKAREFDVARTAGAMELVYRQLARAPRYAAARSSLESGTSHMAATPT